MKKISFCITCKNRFHQISKTLGRNLKDNESLQKDVEFILVDFDSHDGLRDWVLTNFSEELASGYLKFFHTAELPSWDCSVAKNTSHYLATGTILVNLDCDNYTGKNGALFVLKQFSIYGPKLLLHQASGKPSDGSFGRIAVRRSYFLAVGGYNQSFNPMGYQDTDLIHRLIAHGLFYIIKTQSAYNQAIPNTKEESIKYSNSEKPYLQMDRENKLLSKKSIAEGNIIVNAGSIGITENIFQLI